MQHRVALTSNDLTSSLVIRDGKSDLRVSAPALYSYIFISGARLQMYTAMDCNVNGAMTIAEYPDLLGPCMFTCHSSLIGDATCADTWRLAYMHSQDVLTQDYWHICKALLYGHWFR